MEKTCKTCGDPYESSGIDPCSGLCRSCCYEKRNKSKKLTQLKRTPLKRPTAKKQKTYFKKAKKNRTTAASRFRRYVEAKAKHDCEKWGSITCCITGAFICEQGDDYSQIKGMCCSHIIPGSKGRKFYWILDASVWMTPEVHMKYETATQEQMNEFISICPEIERRREWLLSLSEEEIKTLSIK